MSTALSMVAVPLLSKNLSKAAVILAAYILTAAAGYLIIRYRGEVRSSSVMRSVDADARSLNGRSIYVGVMGYLAAVPVVFLLSLISAVLLGGGEEGINPAIPVLVGTETEFDRLLIVFNVVLLAPLFEEFLFRGFLFQQFRRFYGPTHGIALSALVFAAVHMSIESFLPLFGLGILLGLVYHHTQSLWASMVTHALWNLGTVAAVTTLFG